MFGKGGGPLNAWIKEFCELVFIQTLQAFIFALVMAFIINILNNQVVMEQADRSTSLGIICIVVLTSIFKVEDIARRIFGFGPTKADHGNAVQSIGKTMMAMRMGKNLLDNAGKTISGAGAFLGSHKKALKAGKRRQRRMDALEKDNNGDYGDSSPTLPTGVAVSGEPAAGGGNSSAEQKQKLLQRAAEKRNEAINLRKEVQNIRKNKSSKLSKSKRNDEINKLEARALNADQAARNFEKKAYAIPDDPISNVNVARNSSTSSNKGGGRIKDYNQKKMQIEEDYDKQMDEIKKQKREGLKQMASGFMESGAALVGFTAGTAMSVASTNDWGGAVKDGIAWAGTADAVAAGAVDIADKTGEFLADRWNNAASLASEYNKNVSDAYAESLKSMERDGKTIDAEVERTLRREARKTGASRTAASHSLIEQKKKWDATVARMDKKNATPKAGETDRGVYR